MSPLRWQSLPKVLVSIPWRLTDHPNVVTIAERVLRVGSDMYPVSAMSAVHVDTWRPHEGWQARRQFLRTSIYAGLPIAVLGIGVLREGQMHTVVGGLLLGVGVLLLGIGLGRYIHHLRRPELFELVAVMGGKRRGLFTCRDHDFVWAIQDGLEKAMNTTGTMTTMTFTINGGQGFQFGNGNKQYNNFRGR